MRARAGLPSLRGDRLFGAIRAAIGAASGDTFQVLQFSVQSDHVHLIVEAEAAGFVRGAQGLVIRLARAINRALGRRGGVWADRYHARALRTPREVRHGLVYVLMNFRKHRPWDRREIDPCSSAWWFDGFQGPTPRCRVYPPVRAPRTWLASVGWRCHGLIYPAERPTTSERPAARSWSRE